MKKKHKSFIRLKKSTVITMVSCGSFVLMTFLGLLFFVKFPIKPSEKIISSMGRQGIYRRNISYSTDIPATTTQTTLSVTDTDTRQTTTASTTHKEFIITITTGKGFKTEFEGHDVYVMDYDYDDYEDYINDNKEKITTITTYDGDEYDYDYDYDYDWNY